MVIILVCLALFALGLGAFGVTVATSGVGFIGGACFFAILARIAQASAQHREILAAIKGEAVVEPVVAPRVESVAV